MSDGSGAILRRLVASDIPAAIGLSEEAGWNQTSEDWRMLIELAPQGCLAIEADGQLAATTTLLCYGRRLAWIGMVLTRISKRGRGFARRLLTQALAQADQMRIETVKLDATDQGRPLYEKMGFRFEQAVERWSRPASSNSSATTRLVDALPAGNWRRADRRAFGADRSELLERLSQRSQPSLFIGGSYLLTRSGHHTRYLGPSVCDTPETARALVARALQAEPSQRWSWDLLPNNVAAATIARDLTFTPSRRLQRMVRGNELRAKEEMIYAIAGFELG
jgi:N-acetylglutamate synthase-like GNAT family acetyltransferase